MLKKLELRQVKKIIDKDIKEWYDISLTHIETMNYIKENELEFNDTKGDNIKNLVLYADKLGSFVYSYIDLSISIKYFLISSIDKKDDSLDVQYFMKNIILNIYEIYKKRGELTSSGLKKFIERDLNINHDLNKYSKKLRHSYKEHNSKFKNIRNATLGHRDPSFYKTHQLLKNLDANELVRIAMDFKDNYLLVINEGIRILTKMTKEFKI